MEKVPLEDLPDRLEALPEWYCIPTLEGRSDSWFASRRCVRFDPDVQSTVLQELARKKYSELDWSKMRPFWKSGEWWDEREENVLVIDRLAKVGSERRMATRLVEDRISRRRESKYGERSGTKEYARKYYGENRERVLAAQKRYQEKRKEKLREYEEQKFEKKEERPEETYLEGQQSIIERLMQMQKGEEG